MALDKLADAVGQARLDRVQGLPLRVAIEIVQHLRRARVALRGQLAQRLEHHTIQVSAQFRCLGRSQCLGPQADLAGPPRGLMANCARLFAAALLALPRPHVGAYSAKGQLTGQKLIEQHAEGIDVCRGGDRLAQQLLRAGVIRSEHPLRILVGNCIVRVKRVIGIHQPGNPEIEQFGRSVRAHQHVHRLQIPMNHHVAMGIGNG